MEESNKVEAEDAQNLYARKLVIGGMIFFGCLAILFFFVFEKSPKLFCNACKDGKLKPIAILVCSQLVKIPFSKSRFPYSIAKSTLCRCNNCGARNWASMNVVENQLSFSNNWGGGSDFDCPFCNGTMKADGNVHSDCAIIFPYKCNLCNQELVLINCYDQPISKAKLFFKDVGL